MVLIDVICIEIESNMPQEYRMSIKVNKDMIDENFHVNNIEYLKWVQKIAKEHWHYYSTEELQKGFAWVVLDHHIQYKGQAFLDDELSLVTYIEKSTAVTTTRIVEIYKENKLITKACTTWCMLNSVTRKPARINNEIISLFELEV